MPTLIRATRLAKTVYLAAHPAPGRAIVFASLGADDAAGGQKCRGHRSEAVSSHAI
jgi:hypothetical protein